MSMDFAIRVVGGVVAAMVGWQFGLILTSSSSDNQILYVFTIAAGTFGIGLLITPYLTIRPFNWAKTRVTNMPAQDVVAGAIGLVVGLLTAALLALPLSLLPSYLGRFLPVVASLVLGYFGATIMVTHRREVFNLLGFPRDGGGRKGTIDQKVVLDTSAIIDGRVADISHTGFIVGTMVIPRFVLGELQQIADSPDAVRRNRGRRGLEMLNKLQKESVVPIEISDAEIDGVPDVDGKLIRLAKNVRCPIITNDYNLNRVAELQGVKVLNINELANAVKSVVFPGEEMVVRIIQEGKEFGQGVAYLDDGTMVVVENGRRHINSDLDIVVTRVLQTVAGRMIFAHPKLSHPA
ncbi:MAG TPA: PIN domain-containing protein [Chloroflexota bacterium]